MLRGPIRAPQSRCTLILLHGRQAARGWTRGSGLSSYVCTSGWPRAKPCLRSLLCGWTSHAIHMAQAKGRHVLSDVSVFHLLISPSTIL